jgi:hypothetical protein
MHSKPLQIGPARQDQEVFQLMLPAPAYGALVERNKFIRASLHLATDPDTRNDLLDELGTATRELAELILRKEGRLRSPLEP